MVVGINVVGSFLLGVLTASDASAPVRDGLGVGVLGGLTTFSTFSVQALLEAEDGRFLSAVTYVAVSVVAGIAAAALGYLATKHLA